MKWSTLFSALSIVVAASGAYFSYHVGVQQNRIQSAAARTEQTGWLQIGDSVTARTLLGEEKYDTTVSGPNLGEAIEEYTVRASVDLSYYVYNKSSLALDIVGLGIIETRVRDWNIWQRMVDITLRNPSHVPIDSEAGIARVIEPGDSLLVTQKSSMIHADSSGWSSCYVMIAAATPFNRIATTLARIEFFSPLAQTPAPVLPTSMLRFMRVLPALARIDGYIYQVMSDNEEYELARLAKAQAKDDSLRLLTELQYEIANQSRVTPYFRMRLVSSRGDTLNVLDTSK